jgi:hypothetical protein
MTPESLIAVALAVESPGSDGKLVATPFDQTNAGPETVVRPDLTDVFPTTLPKLLTLTTLLESAPAGGLIGVSV